MTIITNIAIDRHGKGGLPAAPDDILREKSGIIKQNKPVVLGYDMNLPLAKSLAAKKNSSYHIIYPENLDNFTFDELNGKIAIKALNLIKDKFPISEEAFKKGMKAKPSCRLEELEGSKIEYLTKKLNLQHPPAKLFLEFKSNEYSIVYIYIYVSICIENYNKRDKE